MAFENVFQHKGKVYNVHPLDDEIKREFEVWLRAEVARRREKQRVEDPAAYEADTRAYEADTAGDRLAYHGDLGRRFLKTPGGLNALAALLFGCDLKEMESLFAEREADVVAALLAVIPH